MATRKPIYLDANGALTEMNLSDELPVGLLPELTDLAVPATTLLEGVWPGDIIQFDGNKWRNTPLSFGSPGAAGSVCFYCASPTVHQKSAENAFPVHSLSTTPITTGELGVSVVCPADSEVVLAAWRYDTPLGITTLPSGIWSPFIYCSVDDASGITWNTRNIAEIIGSGAVTLTTSGEGTTRTATASSGFFASGDAGTTWLETPKGLYKITAYTSATQVTIEVPLTYGNETVAFTGSRWKVLFATYSIDINGITPTEMPMGWDSVQNNFSIASTSTIGIIDQVSNANGVGSITVTMTYDGGEDFTQHTRLFSTIPMGGADNVGPLTTTQMADLTSMHIDALTPATVHALNDTLIASLTSTQVGKLTSTQLQGLTATQVASLPTTAIAGLTSTQLSSFRTAQIKALGNGTDAIKLPVGTTAQRPTPVMGSARLNSSTGRMEWYDGTNWRIAETAPDTFAVKYSVTGAGGGGAGVYGGGGAAGGVREDTVNGLLCATGTSYTVTIGAGGVGGSNVFPGTNGTDGGDSVFSTIISDGGGGGGHFQTNGTAGGSGGGGGGGNPGAGIGGISITPPTQGYAGGNGANNTEPTAGGGGGAGAVGANAVAGVSAGNGGAGITSTITGTSVNLGGGGGGGAGQNRTIGTGTHGGGNGGCNSTSLMPTAGAANTGGGGGGGGTSGTAQGTGANGGSGRVVLKYPDAYSINISGGLTGTEFAAEPGFKMAVFTAGTGTVFWT